MEKLKVIYGILHYEIMISKLSAKWNGIPTWYLDDWWGRKANGKINKLERIKVSYLRSRRLLNHSESGVNVLKIKNERWFTKKRTLSINCSLNV